jgi:divalent metal cation (Fe/Co/Zn/Cd) transporter
MSVDEQVASPEVLRRVIRIQTLTLLWMSVEVAASLGAAWKARSPALLAFGGDSAVELISAVIVRRRFRVQVRQEQAESRATRIAGFLLLALAAFVVVASAVTLLRHAEPTQSYLGIAVLIVASVFMPWLAKEKRRLSAITGSAALRADAVESALCGYLSLIALVGLAVNAIWHIAWADPVAALCLVPFIVREGWEVVQGKRDECCS